MKIIIIGGGITGLYIGHMLKKNNIDFDIYECSSNIGGKIIKKNNFDKKVKYQLYPHHQNIINLMKELNIEINLIPKIDNKIIFDNKLFDKIKSIYTKKPINDILVDTFIKNNLTTAEYDIFSSYIRDLKLDQMEISDYMTYNHDDLLLINQSSQMIEIDYSIIEKLSANIKNNIYINHTVQNITYMPITNNYILSINDIFINANKLILTTNMNIQLRIPPIIQSQFKFIKSYNLLKICTPKKSYDDIDYPIIIKTKLAKYSYKNAYNINQKRIQINFYKKYNLILAIHPFQNSLEGSCICAINVINIIKKEIYSKRSEYLFNF